MPRPIRSAARTAFAALQLVLLGAVLLGLRSPVEVLLGAVVIGLLLLSSSRLRPEPRGGSRAAETSSARLPHRRAA